MEQSLSAIDAALRRIRIRRWTVFGLFAGWLPFMVVISNLTSSNSVETIGALLYMAIVVIFGAIAGFSACPRCKNLFFMRTFSNILAGRCMNCGLPLSGEDA
ncbi:hypothetical protein [Dyella sp. Tek66A03]|uniref:hypothetical protein n=1 Tax=Dyella sp. Tek66A03 TaxID=3458298 RepID=UPI00403E7A9A